MSDRGERSTLSEDGAFGRPEAVLGTTGQATEKRDCPIQHGTCRCPRKHTGLRGLLLDSTSGFRIMIWRPDSIKDRHVCGKGIRYIFQRRSNDIMLVWCGNLDKSISAVSSSPSDHSQLNITRRTSSQIQKTCIIRSFLPVEINISKNNFLSLIP
ncbi:hypothetical protein AVEN_169829-1 [Araneus ventricosus]|uniref:Uncharacterized protein n=1 Tax=Araneus ventricosus TaxID=182803 RepID=A0A4Y2PUD8_ARAVE|nr:hypothetical protein AVEN_169829-1 [Araneus ventricosus]